MERPFPLLKTALNEFHNIELRPLHLLTPAVTALQRKAIARAAEGRGSGRHLSLGQPPRTDFAAAQTTRASQLLALRDSLWALVLPAIVLVGLKMGFTSTEAADAAAMHALFVATVAYRKSSLAGLYRVFVSAAKTTAVMMLLIAAAMVSAWLITAADTPADVTRMLEPLLEHPTPLMDLACAPALL